MLGCLLTILLCFSAAWPLERFVAKLFNCLADWHYSRLPFHSIILTALPFNCLVAWLFDGFVAGLLDCSAV